MGNPDNWTEPKQNKLARQTERPLHRGPLRKGERRKGKKARIDELLSAKRGAEMYAKWMLEERKRKVEHPEWYKPSPRGYVRWEPHWEESFDKAATKLAKLVEQAMKDGVITEVGQWRVKNPKEDYIHICDIDDFIAQLQQLKAKAQEHFGSDWPRV